MLTSAVESRRLTLHPLAIHTFIKAQAGSLGKALSESVMNSLDAGATRVDINVSELGYTIEDDGSGFMSRQEIYSWFETLGFPHDDEGNHRTWGKFGLGRAQAWAYASNVWHTNEFLMHVDVQRKGLDYVLEETSQRNGTLIRGTFYTPLTDTQRLQLDEELTRLLRYVPGDVFLNYKKINEDPAKEQWDLETNEAYFRFDPKGWQLHVYNGGVLVNHFQKYRFGQAGAVVTKPEATLSLNIARNDILPDCPVWKKVLAAFPATKQDAPKPKVVKDTEEELKAYAQQVKDGTLPLFDALEAHPLLITSVHGRGMKYWDLVSDWRAPVVLFTRKGDELGKRITKLRLGAAVSLDTLKLWGFEDPNQLKALFAKSLEERNDQRDNFKDHPWTTDAKAAFPSLVNDRITLTAAELSAADMAALTSLRTSANFFAKDLTRLASERGLTLPGKLTEAGRPGAIDLGDAPANLAWVGDDGGLVLRRAEAVKAVEGGVSKVISHLVQALKAAYAEGLGSELDGLLLALVTETTTVGDFAQAVASRHIYECKKRDLPVHPRKLSELAQIGIS